MKTEKNSSSCLGLYPATAAAGHKTFYLGHYFLWVIISLVLALALVSGQASGPNADPDGDNIVNSVDRDDDNDGISDTVEMQCPTMAAWTDWTSVAGNRLSATGTLALPSGNVTVTLTNTLPQLYSIQNIDWADQNFAGTMPNTYTECIQSQHGASATHTVTFSAPVDNPIITFFSNNGNTFVFDKPFEVVGTPTTQTINSTTSITGTGEGQVALRFVGSFSSISYTSTILENWTGVSVGAYRCPDPDTDSDGLVDRVDLDSDNDGIPDHIEGQPTASYSAGATSIATPADTDRDGTPDYLDTNSNNRGGSDTADAGLTPGAFNDADSDGLDDDIDTNDSSHGPVHAGITNILASYPKTFVTYEVDWRFLPAPGSVGRATYACNLVKNSDFATGNLSQWTSTGGWAFEAGYAVNYFADTTQTLSQNISGLHSARNAAGNIVLTFLAHTNNTSRSATASAAIADLDVYLGGTRFVNLRNDETMTAKVTFHGGASGTPATFPVGTATVLNNLISVTIPWSTGLDTALLEFRMTAPGNHDDFAIDNITINGYCPMSLAAWYKADALTDADGASVQTWRDSSPTGFDVSQATAGARPLYYRTTANRLVNFNPSLFFNDAQELKNLNRLFPATSGFSLFGVGVRTTANGATLDAILGMGSDGNHPAMDLQLDAYSPVNGWNPYMAGGSPAEWGGGGPGQNSTAPVTALNQPLLAALVTGNFSPAAANNIESWLNGFQEQTTLDAIQQPQIGNGLFVGSSADAQFIGMIPEVIIYDGPLPDIEVKKVQTYLAIKYGITLHHDYISPAGADLYQVGSVVNGKFTGNANGWTYYSGWQHVPASGSMQYIQDSGTDVALSQAVAGLNHGSVANQVQLRFKLSATNYNNVSNSAQTATLAVKLGGTTYATIFNPNGSNTITVTAANSATVSPATLTPGAAAVTVSVNIPWVNKPNCELLEFVMTTNGDDFYLDDVEILGPGGFDNRITGIGREDCADLYQKQSLSQHNGLITIGASNTIAATNAANGATLSNGSYLIFGDDNGSLEGTVGGLPGTPPADAGSKISRIWRAVETGSVGSTRLSFPTNGVAGSINMAGKFWLVTADDAAFTQNVRYFQTTSTGSPRTVDLDLVSGTTDANNDKVVYFTIAGEGVPGPGCVTQNLRFWLKGDFGLDVSADGAAVGQWADVPNMLNTLTQATAAAKPTLRLNGMNWNPALDFDNDDWLQRPSNTVWSAASDPTTIFTVSTVDTTGDAYNTLISFGGPADYPSLHWHTARPNFFIYHVVSDFGYHVPAYSAGFPLSTPTLFTAWAKQNADTDNIAISVNGIANRAVHDPATNTYPASLAALVVGAENTYGGETHDGMISEVIVYNRKLSDDEIKKVNSYLAIKYGITLSESYVDPAGGVIFPADGAGAAQVYDNRITGLGREDCTTLNQKQSRSVAAGSQISIALSSFAAHNLENANEHANDSTYFVIGDNNAATASISLPGGVDSRIAAAGLTRMTQRKWRAVETGSVGPIRIRVPKAAFPGLYWESMRLLVTEQGGADSFATLAVNPIAPAAFGPAEVEFVYDFPANSDPSQSVYFAFAGVASPTPACVNGVRLWVRADESTFSDVAAVTPAVTGGQVHAWDDQSGNGFHLRKLNTNGSLLGDAASTRFNFNPFLDYNNQLGYKTVASGVAAAADDGDVFIVANWSGPHQDFAGFNTPSSEGGTLQSDYSNYFIASDQMFYWNFNGSPNSVTGGGTLAQGITTLLGYRWAANTITMDANGLQRHAAGVSNDSPGTGTFQVGEGPGGDNVGNFDIAEVIFFNRSLSAAERQKVNTGLAVKYGVTLQHNYVSPGGAILFSANGGSSADFDANVFGIAREVCAGLHQKQSRSVNAGARMTIGIDNEIAAANAAHTGGIAVDSSYLIIGDNGATGLTNLSPGAPCVPPGNDRATNLVYKVQETGTIESIKLTVDLSGLGFNSSFPVFMQVSDSSAFTMWDNLVMTRAAGSTYTANVDFNGTKYVRFSGNATAPANLCTTDKVFHWYHRGGSPIPPWNVTLTGWNVNSLAQTFTESVAPNHTITATVTDPQNRIYATSWYPTTNHGNFLYIPRHENAANESDVVRTTITMNKPAASVSFSLMDIDGWVRGKDVVKVFGKLGGSGPVNPKLTLPWPGATESRTKTAVDTLKAGLWAWDTTPAATAHVAFDEPIDEIVIEYTKDNHYPFKVFNDLRIGQIKIKCLPPAPVVPNPDNVYVFKEADTDEAKTDESFTYKFTLQNLGCENKTINFTDTLPPNLTWEADSLATSLTTGAANAYANTRQLTVPGIVVPPGTHYLYASAKASAAGSYNNQATFTVTASGNTYASDWPDLGGAADATPLTITQNSPAASVTITKSADVSQVQVSGEVEYTFVVTNSESAAVKVNFQDNLQEESTYVAGSLSGITSGTPPTGPVVQAYGGESALLIQGLTVPANGSVTFKVRADMNGTPALTDVKNVATITVEPGQGFRSSTVTSNETSVTVVNDVDGDGVSASIDVDDDNDGVPDTVELANARPGSGGDSDGDGLTDDVDPDSDNDGIPDVIEYGGIDANGDGRVDGTVDPVTGQIGTALTPADTDGDGRVDAVDLDSDNDGITDVRESNGVDANRDGMADSGLTSGSLPDSDGDGVPDVRDLDSDNDGLSDLKESGYTLADSNGDSIVDGPDSDNDGLRDSADADDTTFGEGANGDTAPADSDSAAAAPANDGIPDYRDLDSDGDGQNDIVEAGLGSFDTDSDGRVNGAGDTDGDGILNVIDSKPAVGGWLLDAAADADGDGISNAAEGMGVTDTDGDGVPDALDKDSDNDGILDAAELAADRDGDGIANFRDLDSDNDGINDVREADGPDADNNGIADGTPDNHGSPVPAGLTAPDSDGDGRRDYLDLDSDNDGVSDLIENGASNVEDLNGDGVVDGPDADGDGIMDSVDGDDSARGDTGDPLPRNTDGADLPDFRDLDSDNNGTKDIVQIAGLPDANNDGKVDGAFADADNDGIADSIDSSVGTYGGIIDPNGDADGDGLTNSQEGMGVADSDGDGVPDYRDADTDNDGISDMDERTNAINGGDTDGDGLPDFRDLDSDNDGINDVREANGTDANGDGKLDGTVGTNGMVGTGLSTPDTDNDGRKDYTDLDSDNDSVSDLAESGHPGLIDANFDGVVDGPDADGDGIRDSADGNDSLFGDAGDPAPRNSDADPAADFRDTDSDGDGTNDITEAGNGQLDANGDGRIDAATPDTDNDGIPDAADTADTGFGGLSDPAGDADGDGIPNSNEGNGLRDADGDGVPDSRDLDTDNDGILDSVEGSSDPDGDGVPNFRDLDSDNDGINDVREAGGTDANNDGRADGTPDASGRPVPAGLTPPNSDTDSKPDYIDLDSDNDGVSDLSESGNLALIDANGDGVVDGPASTEDTDGDGIMASADGTPTTWGDASDPAPRNTVPGGRGDYADLDGAAVVADPTVDADGDGIPDSVDTNDAVFGGLGDPNADDDNDGLTNGEEGGPTTDTDGDGVPNYRDLDSDNDGIRDSVELVNARPGSNGDTDGDGLKDWLDLDSDNDGINDVREANGTDTDHDGLVDGNATGLDTDGDGLRNSADPSNGGTFLNPPDTDGDGRKDYVDLDSDNDTIGDLAENAAPGVLDANNDGVVDGTDSDNDGIRNSADGRSGWGDTSDPLPANTDGADQPDFRDLDSDNDGTRDIVEVGNGNLDTNNDGRADGPDADNDGVKDPADANTGGFGGATNPLGDTDGDGYSDFQEGPAGRDTDGDGVEDRFDLDSDNDGIPDATERANSINSGDTDGDGVPDFRDLDSDNDGISDVREAGGSDANGDGQIGAAAITDTNRDGLHDPLALTPLPVFDTDLDGRKDYLDIDSDNDGISDLVECGCGYSDADHNGLIDGTDADGDGILGEADAKGTWGDQNDLIPDNSDAPADSLPDYRDLDSDQDGVKDIAEAGYGALDANNDGRVDNNTDTDSDGAADVVDARDTVFGGLADPAADADGDGVPNSQEGPGNADTDGDGVPDYLDIDSDNDGISDAVENAATPGRTDTDGDGVPNFRDLDSDNDGINDVIEAGGTDANGDGRMDGTVGTNGIVGSGLNPPDTDGDGAKNFVDLDSDNDSVSDLVESGTVGLIDANNDGVVDGPDSDGDGIRDSADGLAGAFGDNNSPAPANTDGADVPDYLDSDSNNDGTRDIVDAGNGSLDANNDGRIDTVVDADKDGIADSVDASPTVFGGLTNPAVDSDGDGLSDAQEGPAGADTDGDGVPDAMDLDSDNDGILDSVEMANARPGCNLDTDCDGVPDFRDLDSDNDGINDVREAGGTDANGDGKADGAPNSSGVPASAGAGLTPPDTDGDGRRNYVDLDSDGDTVPDLYENGVGAASDTNRDGMLSTADTGVTDADKDGIMSPVDARPTWSDSADPAPTDAPAPDTDTTPNYLDLDSDGDGLNDIVEAGNGALDANNDGRADGTTDADADGIIEPVDTNPGAPGGTGDPTADYDGDGLPNSAEGNGYLDTDGDGVPNSRDADSDNDGIPDATERANATNNGDSDGDGIKDWLDLDSDNDGINDVLEAGGTDANGDGRQDGTVGANGMAGSGLAPGDADADGKPNYLDLDSDNDSVSDLVESGTAGLADANNDGVVDGPDADGDGIRDSADNNDTAFGETDDAAPAEQGGADADTTPDYLDTDSDGDGTPDITEAGNGAIDANNDGRIDSSTDSDGDGIADVADTNDAAFGGLGSPAADSDGDGISNALEGLGDTDGDGIPNNQDADSDNDGIADVVEGSADADGDGIPNFRDLDSDNDGINDVREAGGTDANGDGRQDGTAGANGMVGTGLTPGDADGDGRPNYLDLDSDNDSVSDLVESGIAGIVDANRDGVADGPDADGDGIVDSADGIDTAFGDQDDSAPVDQGGADTDTTPDYLDTDSDGDGTPDITEAGNGALDANNDGRVDGTADADGDGILDPADTNDTAPGGLSDPAGDNDGDGIPNSQEGNGLIDTDGDGLPDSSDADSDNDGISDATEKSQAPASGDTDGDGVPNWRDLDSDNDGINDVREAGGTDANGDGRQDGTAGANGMVGTGLTPGDADADGKPNYLDLDSDNDSVSDLVESGNPAADANNDGVVDGPDADGDGIPNSTDGHTGFGDSGDAAPVNTDGADARDYLDSDSDNDGTPDISEAGNGALDADSDGRVDGNADADGDGISDAADTNDAAFGGLSNPAGDNDGDGVPNSLEGNGITDTDGDGVPDNRDADSDGDGISDATEGSADTDGDGVPNFRDLDSDNDGINDVREAAANGIGNDANNDGIMDGAIGTNGMVGAGVTPADIDNDGKPNYLDLDSDNDTISDLVEYGSAAVKAADTNMDGIVDGTDSDGDGIIGAADGKAGYGDMGDAVPVDQPAPDADTMPDYLDIDSNGDGTNDIVTTGNGSLDSNGDGMVDNTADADGDGIPDVIDSNDTGRGGLSDPAGDNDGDGIPNSQEGNGLRDTDGDGVPDTTDADSDNDGISDATERANAINGGDTDGDGVKDWLDLDSDNDGINDVREAGGTDANGDGMHDGTPGTNGMAGAGLTPPDTDGDSRPNYLDLDSDNDSASDLVEAGLAMLDPNNDGMVDGTDPDGDGIRGGADGAPTSRGDSADAPPANTDGTDVPDYIDADSDNDGIRDIVENGNGALDANNDGRVDDTADPDGDGVPNVLDSHDNTFGGIANPAGDDDSDGIPNNQEGNGNIDTDGDGVPDSRDPDSDNDGILDGIERAQSSFAPNNDTDGDGLPNWRDLDSDNDGINDVREATATGVNRDTNNDGIVDGTDSDNDGLMSSIDPSNGGTTILPVDTDGDGAFDYIDLDSDNDLVSDVVEGGAFGLDADDNGVLDGPDSDGDGIANSVDTKVGFGDLGDPMPQNTDGTDQPDFRDLDSDNDGIKDITEAGMGQFDLNGDGRVDNLADEDHDGIPNEPDVNDTIYGGLGNALGDNDQDGIPNGQEGNGLIDTDGDGVPDNFDRDSDGDGIMDIVEYAHAPLDDHDTDNDGLPNWRDLDSDNDGINDVREANGTDANNDGKQDGPDADNDGLADTVDASFFATPLNPPDTDNDGRRDYLDLDSDNDSVSDLVESGHPGLTDADNNGVVDGPDTDKDGIMNSADSAPAVYGDQNDPLPADQPAPDTDTIPDYRDLDSDGDGMRDITENGFGQLDVNNDGRVDNPNDSDGDGIANAVDTSTAFGGLPKQPDNDGDGLVDSIDPDDDNDGTPDVSDAFPLNPNEQTDSDGDGIGNNADPDDDNDGTPDTSDAFPLNPAEQLDSDGDGIGNNADTDDDNDGLSDATEGTGDTDGDGIPDSRDADSDNDGIPDSTERVNAINGGDTDGDGVPDYRDLDSDNDGINDVREAGGTDANGDGIQDGTRGPNGMVGAGLTPPDSDSDGRPNYVDLDSDNDGKFDITENGPAGADANGDGIADGTDPDGDGIRSSVDGSPTRGDSSDPAPANTDGTDLPNYLDTDSDNDGIPDISGSGLPDTNGDGRIDAPATDADQDGLPDVADTDDAGFGGAPSGFGTWQNTTPGAGPTGAGNGGTPAPAANNDGDDLDDLAEYALGGNPNTGVPLIVGRPTACAGLFTLKGPATNIIHAEYVRPMGRHDVTYQLQTSTDLATWADSNATAVITPNGDGTETVRYNDMDAGQLVGFARIKVGLVSGQVSYSNVAAWCITTFTGSYQTYGCALVPKSPYAGYIASATANTLSVPSSDAMDLRTLMSPSKKYYVEITNGPAEGHRFDVNYAATTAQSVALNLASTRNTASSLPSGLVGASFVIRPHATIGEVLPSANFDGDVDFSAADQILFFDGTSYDSFYYLDAGDPAFRYWAAQSSFDNENETVIAPGQGVFVRQNNPNDTDVVCEVGEVRANLFRRPLNPGYNLIASGFPVASSMVDRGMTLQNGFRGGLDFESSDQIQIWRGDANPSAGGYDSYYMLDAGPGFQYWSALGSFDDVSHTPVFRGNRAQFIRVTNPNGAQTYTPVPWTP